MDSLVLKEKEKYTFLWGQVPSYRNISPGELSVDRFLDHFASQMRPGDRVIDFGCGTGRAAKHFLAQGIHVTLVDFCSNCLDPEIELLLSLFPDRIRFIEACLWDLPKDLGEAEWIYCCDVLEHIPEEKVDMVLKSMSARNVKGGYFSIGLQQDAFGIRVLDTPLHLCIQNKYWWSQKILPHWQMESVVVVPGDKHLHCCVKISKIE